MASDRGSRQPGLPSQDLELPEVLDVRIRQVRYEAPKRRNFTSALPTHREAVEFVVVTDRPIPVRALGPVLYVGDTPVTEVTAREKNVYRFVSFETKALARGARISLGWSGRTRKEDRTSTKFSFELRALEK